MADYIDLYTHPERAANAKKFTKLSDMYEGEHDVMCSSLYLWEHRIESTPDGKKAGLFKARAQRTQYFNLNKILISLWTSLFFKKEIDFSEVENLFEDDIDNVDGQGTSLESMIKHRFLFNMLNYGDIYGLVSSPQVEARSVAEVKASGFRPYIESIDTPKVMDWSIETQDALRIGQLNFVRYEFDRIKQRYSAQDGITLESVSMSHEYMDGVYMIYEYVCPKDRKGENLVNKDGTKKWQLIDVTEVNELDELPLCRYSTKSWLNDASNEALRFHNIRSTKDNIDYFQAYQRLAATGIDASDSQQVQALSEYSITILPENGDIKTIEASESHALEKSLAQSIDYVFKVGLNQLRSIPIDSKGVQGADTQAEEKQNTINLVQSQLGELEDFTNKMVQTYARFKSQPDFDGKVRFNKSITFRDIDTQIMIRGALAESIKRVDVWNKANLKKFVIEESYTDDVTTEILDAIENTSFDTEPVKRFDRESKLTGFFNKANKVTEDEQA